MKKNVVKFCRLLVVLAVIAVAGLATSGESSAATDVCPAVTDNNQTGSNVSSRQSVFIRDDLDENGTCTHAFVANTSIGNMGTDIGLNRVAVTLNTFDNNSPAGSATGIQIDIDSNYTINSMAVTVGGVSTTVAQNIESFKYNTVTTATSFTAVIQIQRNTDNRIFDFTVSKAANSNTLNSISFVPSGGNPEINVKGFSGGSFTNIGDGDTNPIIQNNSLFSSQPIANFNTHTETYTIENLGAGPLTIGTVSLSGSGDFTVEQQPATSLASGADTTFKIKFTPTSGTQQDAIVSIANNDSNEAPYTFSIRATGRANGVLAKSFSPATITLGQTTTVTYNITNPGRVSQLFTDNLPAGLEVANPPNVSPQCGINTNIAPLSAGDTTIQLVQSGNFIDPPSCSYTIDIVATALGTYIDPVDTLDPAYGNHLSSNPSATLTVVAAALDPEINVKGFSGGTFTDIVNGSTTPIIQNNTLFSVQPIANFSSHTETYTIENLGLGALTIGSVSLSGSGDFTVEQQPATSLATGADTTFKIKFTPTSMTQQNSTVSFVNNDGDENPFTFAIRGTGRARPTLGKTFSPGTIVSGGITNITYTLTDPSNAFIGTVTDNLPAGVVVASPANATSNCAVGGFNSASAGSSTVSFLSSLSGTCSFSIDVTAPNSGVFSDSVDTTSIAALDISGATATLTVTGGPEINVVSNGANNIGDGDITPQIGDGTTFTEALVNTTNSTRTFTIQNTGGGILTLNANAVSIAGAHPGDYTVTAQPATTVAAGGNTQFTVQFAPTVAGARNAIININNDDGDENPYDFAITGEGLPLVTLTKSVSPGTIIAGGTATYTYTYNNPTGALYGGVTNSFTDNLPANLIVATPNNTTSTCFSAGLIALAGASAISTTGVIIGVGGCQLTVDVTSNAPATYIDPVETLGQIIDPASNPSSTLTVTPNEADLAITMTDGLTATARGNTIDYTSTATNAGPVEASNVTITHNFPAGLNGCSIISVSPLGGAVGVTFNVGVNQTQTLVTTMPMNGSVITVSRCTVAPTATGTLSVPATIASATTDPNPGNNSATDSDTVINAPSATFSQSNAGPSYAGTTKILSFSITNDSATASLPNIAFTEDLNAALPGLVAIGLPQNNICGAGSQISGTSTISFTGGSLAPGASCSFAVSVQIPGNATVGNKNITSSTLTSNGVAAAGASTTVLVIEPAPTFTKTFAPNTINVGAISTLTFTIDNRAAASSVSALSFADNLPVDVVVAAPASAATTCGGTLTATNGTGVISLTGGNVVAGTTCTVSVDVTSSTVGSHVNTTGNLTSSSGNSGTATDTLTVAAVAPVVTTNAATSVTGTGATLKGQVNANGTSTTVTFEYGTTVAYGTSVTAGQSPVTGITTTAVNKAITGLTPNTTYHYRVVGTNGGGTQNGVDQTFTTAPVSGTVTIVHNVSGPDINVAYSSPTTGLNFSLTSVSGTAQTTLSNIAFGTHIVTAGDLSASGYGITSIVCSDTDSTGDVATKSATINLAAGEAVTCTFALVETREVTSRQIADYLGARNQLVLTHQPNLARRMGRLNDGAGTGEGVASTTAFGLSAQLPFLMNMNLNSNIFSYKASARSMANFINSRSDVGLSAPRLGKWDFWSEGQLALFDSSNNQSGQFGIVHVGADYLARPNVLLGVRAQVDWMDQKFADTNGKLSGRGWMVGPYGLVRLNKKFYVDWSAAWGKSANDISPFGTFKDNFDTTRWMVDGALIGEFALNNWTVRPALRLRYIEETQQAYTDSLNVAIPEQRIAQGELRFGPRFSTSYTLDDGAIFLPWFEFSGGYIINSNGKGSSGSFIDEIEGINGSASAGFDLSLSNGATLTFKGQYDGIGSGAQSYGGTIGFSIPLN